MGSRFNDFYDNITLGDAQTADILKKAEEADNMKQRKGLGAKSVYVTLGALAAAVAITVFGGKFLLDSEILLREPLREQLNEPLQGMGTYLSTPASLDTDIPYQEIERANIIAQTAKEKMNGFLQEELAAGRGMRGEHPYDVIFAVKGETGGYSASSYHLSFTPERHGDLYRATAYGSTEVAETAIAALLDNWFSEWYNEFNIPVYSFRNCVFIFLVENNECLYAAFLPEVPDQSLRPLHKYVALTEDGYRLNNIRAGLDIATQTVIVGTAPAQTYDYFTVDSSSLTATVTHTPDDGKFYTISLIKDEVQIISDVTGIKVTLMGGEKYPGDDSMPAMRAQEFIIADEIPALMKWYNGLELELFNYTEDSIESEIIINSDSDYTVTKSWDDWDDDDLRWELYPIKSSWLFEDAGYDWNGNRSWWRYGRLFSYIENEKGDGFVVLTEFNPNMSHFKAYYYKAANPSAPPVSAH